MKYGKTLLKLMNLDLNYLDYNFLKKEVSCNHFLSTLKEQIQDFNLKYIDLYNKKILIEKYTTYQLYQYLLLNYLSINKLIKKYYKKNSIPIEKYINIPVFLSKFTFYHHIMNLPLYYDLSEYKTDDYNCPICLDKCYFPITTECNHTFCWKCISECSINSKLCPYCKQDVKLDPALIILNNLLECDSKYSITNSKLTYSSNELNTYHILSDLHIDQWSEEYDNKYPCGLIKNIPFKLPDTFQEKTLIVAGDISDNIELSIQYLNRLSEKYSKILFVDGNHEHVHRYPKLYSPKEIYQKVKENNNPKLVYLSHQSYLVGKTVFLGVCGWWDYNGDNQKEKESCYHYFDNWIPHFGIQENKEFIENVSQQSKKDYLFLKDNLDKYHNNSEIEKIIIVSHCLPSDDFCDDNIVKTECNTKFKKLLNKDKYPKLESWIFGHTHESFNLNKEDIKFICHPRGRPEDFNRQDFNSIEIMI